jgi:hypothetical protein
MIDVAEWSWKQIEQTIRDGAEVAVYVLRQMPTGILIIEAERVFSSRMVSGQIEWHTPTTIAVEKPTIFVKDSAHQLSASHKFDAEGVIGSR